VICERVQKEEMFAFFEYAAFRQAANPFRRPKEMQDMPSGPGIVVQVAKGWCKECFGFSWHKEKLVRCENRET
jgi:hypothetical protein